MSESKSDNRSRTSQPKESPPLLKDQINHLVDEIDKSETVDCDNRLGQLKTLTKMVDEFEEQLIEEQLREYMKASDRAVKVLRLGNQSKLGANEQSIFADRHLCRAIVESVKLKFELIGDGSKTNSPLPLTLQGRTIVLKKIWNLTGGNTSFESFKKRLDTQSLLKNALPSPRGDGWFQRDINLVQIMLRKVLKCPFDGNLRHTELLKFLKMLASPKELTAREFLRAFPKKRSSAANQLVSFLKESERNVRAIEIAEQIIKAIEKETSRFRTYISRLESIAHPLAVRSDDLDLIFEELPWEILPTKNFALRKLRIHFTDLTKNGSKWSGRTYEEERLRFIHNELRPSCGYLGKEGFLGYVVYGFLRTNRVVLECPYYGNATYVLKDKWQTISRLSKWEAREIHSDIVAVVRHTGAWQERLVEELRLVY